MKKIYLAIPYSHKLKGIRKYRFRVACRIAKLLILQGYIVTCPILQTHNLELPADWEFWKAHDMVFLKWYDELWVIMSAGWEISEGVQLKIKTAKTLNKKIVYLEPSYE